MKQAFDRDSLPFMKMHGLGNDFVVIDSRQTGAIVTPDLARAVGHRHTGVGFDQLAEILKSNETDAELVFYNSDGSTSGACGNATRCIARYLMNESGAEKISLRTERGILLGEDAGNGLTRINMGAPLLQWDEIPIASKMDTLSLPIDGDPVATGMGNPHCTFIVEDAESVDLEKLGAEFETHPLYPERTNVEFISRVAPNRIRMRIWERGVGVTMASGSGSCASAVAAARRGLTGRSVEVVTDGGMLTIDWRDDGVWMTGPTMHAFDASLSRQFLESI
ncbi:MULTISPECIES: diaminopimelate epimerase [Halocynthiibacter]|uniref:Diaminopimelate epimerase n=1 Tax=Halocynthiibacter halioticoli TaxID=2986804 RepID=A0AAE3LU81_9RHOB|nr:MULTISPECIES: diaminopimelate epimerase [Halocynthiibacter]MCV6823155.1 diaminopimelate epimerase [Halocynthiibacter halioticoli]MCW4056156.1 diaminopimelate epimerase [Halocynthiibacter sp. SDUM655004]